jgi:hypothetical protein
LNDNNKYCDQSETTEINYFIYLDRIIQVMTALKCLDEEKKYLRYLLKLATPKQLTFLYSGGKSRIEAAVALVLCPQGYSVDARRMLELDIVL